MKARLHPLQLAAALLLVCVCVLGGLYWRRLAVRITPAALMAFLPDGDGTRLYVDFGAARGAGLLRLIGGDASDQDADYRRFVSQTRFDYQRDLDAAAAVFLSGGEFFILRGRFDWPTLIRYVNDQGGSCGNGFCQMNGSRPDRKISFYPVRKNLLAFAVSPDDAAAKRVREGAARAGSAPDGPLWISTRAATLEQSPLIPAPARPLLAALDATGPIVFTLSPAGDGLALKAQFDCRDASAATLLEAQLEAATAGLRGALARQHAGLDPASVPGVLTSGTFRARDARVIGEWPLSRLLSANADQRGAN